MVGKIKYLVLVVILLIGVTGAKAQFGVSGGISMLKGFGVPKPYIGMHFGGEIPRDDQISLYARLSLYARQQEPTNGYTIVTATDFTTVPYSQTISYASTFNYTIIEGGTRYYIGNGYDSGFGAYGGSTLMLAVNSVKRKYGDYDQSKYELPTNELSKGSIFNLGFGLGGGVKNTFAGIGTVYLDMNLAYMILSTASNSTAQSTSLYAPLLFSFNLGFRKEFY
ncbi:MAG: hypothetical protein RL632_2333 [Bacteroidota bacterium]|jgi:hypothetical protein